MAAVVHILLALVLAPLLVGVVNRTKAVIAGRRGQPLLQLYYDLAKLTRKGVVYSRTTSWVFRAAPIAALAVPLAAALLMPFGGVSSALAFSGDLIAFAYLFALLRFFIVLAALDTGSSFEGMGASREMTLAALAEPALLLGLATLARQTGSLSLSEIYARVDGTAWLSASAPLALVAGAFIVVFLVENARIPFDDPATHLELTMIHEVMVLDHSGPDLAFILYGSALKLWLLGTLLTGLLVPVRSGVLWFDSAAALAGLFGLAILTGLIESSMARLRLLRAPQILIGASVMSALALVLVWR